jgi:hypothetical protein
MTTIFFLTGGVSLVFFVVFMLMIETPSRTKKNSCPVRKIIRPSNHQPAQLRAMQSMAGRRLFAHLEEQMSEFIAAHGRRVGGLLIFAVVAPLMARAQAPAANASSPAQVSSAADQQIPSAVARQLDAMQKRIDQLEQELNSRRAPDQPGNAVADGGAPVHSVTEQASAPAATVSAESSLAPADPKASQKPAPFSFADFSWLNGNSRVTKLPFDSAFFTPEIRADISYIYDFAHPKDDTIGGSSEVFRSSEFQVTQLGVGGDFHWDNVQARLMTQFGMYSETTPRNDASPGRGQWNLADAYRYVSEAYAGYHINAMDGINIQAGIFMSYIGLFSYYNFDNWAYQPSYVSSNTPWFFNGMRVQIFPNQHLKIEPWLIN